MPPASLCASLCVVLSIALWSSSTDWKPCCVAPLRKLLCTSLQHVCRMQRPCNESPCSANLLTPLKVLHQTDDATPRSSCRPQSVRPLGLNRCCNGRRQPCAPGLRSILFGRGYKLVLLSLAPARPLAPGSPTLPRLWRAVLLRSALGGQPYSLIRARAWARLRTGVKGSRGSMVRCGRGSGPAWLAQSWAGWGCLVPCCRRRSALQSAKI